MDELVMIHQPICEFGALLEREAENMVFAQVANSNHFESWRKHI